LVTEAPTGTKRKAHAHHSPAHCISTALSK